MIKFIRTLTDWKSRKAGYPPSGVWDEAPRALSYNSTIDDLNLREFKVEVSNIGKVSFNKIIHHLPLSKGRKKEDITAAENY